jgi:hypothetical protein
MAEMNGIEPSTSRPSFPDRRRRRRRRSRSRPTGVNYARSSFASRTSCCDLDIGSARVPTAGVHLQLYFNDPIARCPSCCRPLLPLLHTIKCQSRNSRMGPCPDTCGSRRTRPSRPSPIQAARRFASRMLGISDWSRRREKRVPAVGTGAGDLHTIGREFVDVGFIQSAAASTQVAGIDASLGFVPFGHGRQQ